jgi:hypothetical protein
MQKSSNDVASVNQEKQHIDGEPIIKPSDYELENLHQIPRTKQQNHASLPISNRNLMNNLNFTDERRNSSK